jgi:beta-glucanase (GH16 family)
MLRKLCLFLIIIVAFITLSIGNAKPAAAGYWQLVFDEEFNGNGQLPDGSRWNIVDAPSGINAELQYYTPSSMWLWDSQLHIKSEQRQMGDRDYTSGMIVSKQKFKYGKFEIRGRLPRGQGIWPAYWLLQKDCGGWYGCPTWPPEIDILEMLGNNTYRVYTTYHYGQWYRARWPNNTSLSQPVDLGFDTADGYHTYTVEWAPDRIQWYVDGSLKYTVTESMCGYSGCIADEEMSIIINTAVGGNWPGNPDGSTQFPQYHFVDFVKVYQWVN